MTIDMTPEEKAALFSNRCPDCGEGGFLAGPQGGMCQNIMCRNPECGSKFNVGPGTFAERISYPSPDRPGGPGREKDVAMPPATPEEIAKVQRDRLVLMWAYLRNAIAVCLTYPEAAIMASYTAGVYAALDAFDAAVKKMEEEVRNAGG